MNILRLFFLTLIMVAVCSGGHADNIWDTGYHKVFVEDTAHYKVVYVHIANDRVLDEQDVKYEMLSIGDKIITYGGHGTYQIDSIFSTYEVLPSKEECRKIIRECEPIPQSITIDPEKGILTYYGYLFLNHYRYFEPIPHIEWELTDDTEEIMGHKCHKATARWRGREWNAWYSDIPINAGPWKFQGLPGLILKVEDTAGDHSIYAIDSENLRYPIGHSYYPYTKTTREKYNATVKDHAENAGKDLVRSGMVKFKNEEEKNRIAARRKFYAPLELE